MKILDLHPSLLYPRFFVRTSPIDYLAVSRHTKALLTDAISPTINLCMCLGSGCLDFEPHFDFQRPAKAAAGYRYRYSHQPPHLNLPKSKHRSNRMNHIA